MPIDFQNEQPLTFSEAARFLPGHVHITTIHRWRTRGIRNVKLETCLVGGQRYTSKEALQRFIDATTTAADHKPAPMLDERSNPYKRRQGRRKRANAEKVLRQGRISS